MTTGKKILFGLPLLLQVLCIIPIEWMLISHTGSRGDLIKTVMDLDQQTLVQLGGILLVCVILALGTMIAYMIYLMQDSRFSSTQRTTWLILLLLTGMVGQIIFFFKFIRKA